LAKSLAGGLPLGATIVNEKYADVLGYGGHGSTFGGNPVACAAACAVVDALDIKMLDKVKANGKYLVSKLEKIKKKYSFVKEIRAIGLLVALELNISGGDIVAACLEKGLVINCTQDKILRFLPPFIIGKKDINEAVSILDEVLSRLSEK
jgi:acetylornithine/N-succinyldiaminopimelate aminotransferase